MTTRRTSKQGEGQAHCEAGRPYPTPKAWAQLTFAPAMCVRGIVTIHQHAGSDRYCISIEVDDPHTKELLSCVVNPTARRSSLRGIAATAAIDLRAALEAVLDPDPF